MPDPAAWTLCIDTGGTFTDCLALAPDSALRRAKVLSTGCIRARIADVLSPSRLRLDLHLDAPEGFLAGATIRAAGPPSESAAIRAFDARESLIEHDGAAAFTPGLCEIDAGVEAPILAAHLVTRTPLKNPLPPMRLRLATTRGTNALLERRGAPTALFITAGFADLLRIGTQQRPDLFALDILKPESLCESVVEVDECFGMSAVCEIRP